MALGRFAGPIFTIILVMQCLFFTALEWAVPLSEIDMVENEWDDVLFFKVGPTYSISSLIAYLKSINILIRMSRY